MGGGCCRRGDGVLNRRYHGCLCLLYLTTREVWQWRAPTATRGFSPSTHLDGSPLASSPQPVPTNSARLLDLEVHGHLVGSSGPRKTIGWLARSSDDDARGRRSSSLEAWLWWLWFVLHTLDPFSRVKLKILVDWVVVFLE